MMRRVVALIIVVVLGGIAWFLTRESPPAHVTEVRKTPPPAAAPEREPTPPRPDPTPSAPTPKAAPVPRRPSAPADLPAPPAPVDNAPTTGTLRVSADVPDASVFIDRKFIGTAPVTATDVTPGAHHLNVSAPGYDAVSEEIDVTAGARDIAVALKTVKLAATLVVKHKHAMGSCAGTLRATPQGITFETANKDDGFTVAMSDIELFDVDYLAKNLKLKVKNGRTYNFTDPDSNADRLFVFHRDVDKVRKRSPGAPAGQR